MSNEKCLACILGWVPDHGHVRTKNEQVTMVIAGHTHTEIAPGITILIECDHATRVTINRPANETTWPCKECGLEYQTAEDAAGCAEVCPTLNRRTAKP